MCRTTFQQYKYCGIEDETQGWRIVITFFEINED